MRQGQARLPVYREKQNPPTVKQLKVLELAAAGFGCKESASIMGVSLQRIKNLRTAAFHKLGAVNTMQAVVKAMRQGLMQ
jgi:DNA-binding CsgD family transcriptional regulator